jgi:hypothetical protein
MRDPTADPPPPSHHAELRHRHPARCGCGSSPPTKRNHAICRSPSPIHCHLATSPNPATSSAEEGNGEIELTPRVSRCRKRSVVGNTMRVVRSQTNVAACEHRLRQYGAQARNRFYRASLQRTDIFSYLNWSNLLHLNRLTNIILVRLRSAPNVE